MYTFKRIDQHQTDLDFHQGFQGFKNIFDYMYKVDIDICIFLFVQ